MFITRVHFSDLPDRAVLRIMRLFEALPLITACSAGVVTNSERAADGETVGTSSGAHRGFCSAE